MFNLSDYVRNPGSTLEMKNAIHALEWHTMRILLQSAIKASPKSVADLAERCKVLYETERHIALLTKEQIQGFLTCLVRNTGSQYDSIDNCTMPYVRSETVSIPDGAVLKIIDPVTGKEFYSTTRTDNIPLPTVYYCV